MKCPHNNKRISRGELHEWIYCADCDKTLHYQRLHPHVGPTSCEDCGKLKGKRYTRYPKEWNAPCEEWILCRNCLAIRWEKQGRPHISSRR